MPRVGKKVKSEKKIEKITSDESKQTCLSCDNSKKIDFYTTFNKIYKNTNNKLPWCKACVENQYNKYLNKYGDGKLAIFYTCRKFDLFYANSAYEGAEKNTIKTGWTILQSYFKQINSFREQNGYGICFDDSFDFLDIQRLIEKNYELEDDEYDVYNIKKKSTITFTEEDKKAQSDVIRLLGYDPFLEYEMSDKIFLYNDLITYLDEDTVEDAFKCSVVLQIVNNNNQIRKMDIVMNQLNSDITTIARSSKEIESLANVKVKLNIANDRLSKENNIALKHRAGSGSQNSTLGSMMKKLRELDFEKAEHDYYDMCKSYGIRQSAEISNQSIMDILHFDDTDMNNMFKMQRDELQKLQEKELDLKEQIRLLVIENNELKNNK